MAIHVNNKAVAESNEALKALDFSALLLMDKETEAEFMVTQTMERSEDREPFHCEHGFREMESSLKVTVVDDELCKSPATWVVYQDMNDPHNPPFFGCAFHLLYELGPEGHYRVVAGEVTVNVV